MASEIGKYTTLTTICLFFLDQYGKSIKDLDKVKLIGLRALTELNFDISGEPITVRLPLSETGNKTVRFPEGCMQWVKIGVLNENGEICTLKKNNALTTWNDLNPNRLPFSPDINNSIGALANAPIFINYYFEGNFYNLFGVGGGLIQYGDMRVDDKKEVVILNPNFQYDHIMFEYISAPERDSDYKVLTALQEAVIAFIEAKLKLNTMENFYAESIKARRRLNGKKVELQTINQVIRESDAMKLRS